MGKYYTIADMTQLKDSILDYYGAYDIVSNPTGVDVKLTNSTTLIFACTAITDKVIKIIGYEDIITRYGDSFVGSDITNPVIFGGSTTSGATTFAYLVCCNNCLMLNVLASNINSRLVLIGKLTNDNYAVFGAIGSSSSLYFIDAIGKLTIDNTSFTLSGINMDSKIGNKVFKIKPYLVTNTGVLNNLGESVHFRDVWQVSRRLGALNVLKGDGYFISTSNVFSVGGIELTSSLMMEVSN